MKTLFLLRHAKSSWADPEQSDHRRPLKKRGLKDAVRMAGHVASHYTRPELTLYSDAQRSVETLAFFTDSWKLKGKSLCEEPKLYLASSNELLSLLGNVSATTDSVMLVGHNPGLMDLANQLIPRKHYIKRLPTCSVVVLRADVDEWSQLGKARVELSALHLRRELKED